MQNKPNPALDRIRQIKTTSRGRSGYEPTDDFVNPIIEQAAREIAIERNVQPVNSVPLVVPKLPDETDEQYNQRVADINAGRLRFQESDEEKTARLLEIEAADKLIQEQMAGLGGVAPTRTAAYNNINGTVDNMIVVLEGMKRKE